MAKITGVKFRSSGKVYYFDPAGNQTVKGGGVIVETARGVEFGRVVIEPSEVSDEEIVQPLKPIIRVATEQDLEKVRKNDAKIPEARRIAEEKIKQHNLNMKLIDAEFTFDGSKVVFYFSSAGRVDFRELVKDLASVFHTRIELRQIGIRDETRILGGIAPCGRACCCASCMPEFRKVSIKMAKTQGLSLNPSKISGLCGRLMCCLEYENDYYAEASKKMPKVGSAVSTPDGKGVIIGNNMLKMLMKVKVDNPDGSFLFKDYNLDEVKVIRPAKNVEDEKLSREELQRLKELESDN